MLIIISLVIFLGCTSKLTQFMVIGGDASFDSKMETAKDIIHSVSSSIDSAINNEFPAYKRQYSLNPGSVRTDKETFVVIIIKVVEVTPATDSAVMNLIKNQIAKERKNRGIEIEHPHGN